MNSRQIVNWMIRRLFLERKLLQSYQKTDREFNTNLYEKAGEGGKMVFEKEE